MKEVNVTLRLFSFNELGKEAREKALEDHRAFLMEAGDIYEEYLSQDMYADMCEDDEYVIESIEINEYLFFADGNMADVVTYVGKHPRAGITELTFLGTKYVIR